MVTLKDIADAAGVSLAAASLAVNGRTGVSEETRLRVLNAAERAGYVTRAERQRQTGAGFIGFIIEQLPFPIFADIFYGEVVRAIEDEAHQFGLSTGFTVVERERPRESRAKVTQMLQGNRVRGVIVIGGSNLLDDLIRDLALQSIPLVLLDNYLYDLALDSVQMDHTLGGYLATRHLIDLGHQRIGFIAGPPRYRTLSDRRDGYRRAMQDAGLPVSPDLIAEPDPDVNGRKGADEMRRLLAVPDRPTAVFAVSDKAAFGAIQVVQAAGLRIPEDISLSGFDDVEESRHLSPPLTTIAVQKQRMGMLAVRLLAARLGLDASPLVDASPVKLTTPVELVPRASTAPAGASG